ncbi:MAG: hypothetical protein RKO66_00615 [Candidatus Contendobacter sp.]|nr:hypothetical protein [Candidatus Contendobacter sp.]MDS4058923.1 hypothetical protein [Candidatus Contendobacter sp.]
MDDPLGRIEVVREGFGASAAVGSEFRGRRRIAVFVESIMDGVIGRALSNNPLAGHHRRVKHGIELADEQPGAKVEFARKLLLVP